LGALTRERRRAVSASLLLALVVCDRFGGSFGAGARGLRPGARQLWREIREFAAASAGVELNPLDIRDVENRRGCDFGAPAQGGADYAFQCAGAVHHELI